MKFIKSNINVKSILLDSPDNLGIKSKIQTNDQEFIEAYLEDFSKKYLLNIIDLLDNKEYSKKSHSLLNNPNIFLISSILEKKIFDVECYIDEFSNYHYDIILEFNNDSNIIYIRWTDKVDLINNDDINKYTGKKLKKKIFENISKLLNKFSNCEIFESIYELYDYLKSNCIFRNNSNIRNIIGINKFTIEYSIIHLMSLSIIEILEFMNIRFNNLEKLGKLIDYLEKTLPNKKRIKSNIHSKINFNFVKYTWDELGSIKCLINNWCENNKK